jgi:hypothetical protein
MPDSTGSQAMDLDNRKSEAELMTLARDRG